MGLTLEELKNDANFINISDSTLEPREIHKYIVEKADTYDQYVKWLDFRLGEPVIRTWAFRLYIKKYGPAPIVKYTEVERRTFDYTIRRNTWSNFIGGYFPVYEPELRESKNNIYGYTLEPFAPEQFNKWYCENNPMRVGAHLINLKELFEQDEYKHCGYCGVCGNLIEYLKAYKQEPMVEYFGKLGMFPNPTLIRQCKKDPQFKRFLLDNKEEVYKYGPKAILDAYKRKMTLEEAVEWNYKRYNANKITKECQGIKDTGIDRMKLADYMREVGIWPYIDYWNAMVYLGLDLTDTKNVYPKDFRRMHDLRIQERAAMRAKKDAKAKRGLSRKIGQVAKIYEGLCISNEEYSIILPHNCSDFAREGNMLHHCVGRMGYDKKMADQKSIIAFLRKNDDKTKPFVTIEYSLTENNIRQIYGDHDSRPEEKVRAFADVWAAGMKKAVNK